MFKSLLVLIIAMFFVTTPAQATDFSLYPHQLTVTAFYYSNSVTPATLNVATWQRQFYTLELCQAAEATTKATKVPRVSGGSSTLVSYTTSCDPVVQH